MNNTQYARLVEIVGAHDLGVAITLGAHQVCMLQTPAVKIYLIYRTFRIMRPHFILKGTTSCHYQVQGLVCALPAHKIWQGCLLVILTPNQSGSTEIVHLGKVISGTGGQQTT